MIYSADFVEMAGKIGPLNVAKYLHDLGWKSVISKREGVKIFQSEDGNSFFQVDVPMDRQFIDYKFAMYRAIETIARASQRNLEQILLELINPLADILRVRVSDDDVDSGAIFVDDAIKLYENTKRLIAAAAMDILNPRTTYFGRPDARVSEFVSKCRFGQTEIGSYIVSVVCPFSEIENGEYRQLTLFDEKEECANSLTRKVTNKILHSIKSIKESIENGSFDDHANKRGDADNNHISSNFLEALSEMSIYKNNCELDICAIYAPTVRSNTLAYNRVSINHDYFQPLDSIVKKIKNISREEKVYIGKIKNLNATPVLEKRDSGTIHLVFLDDERKRRTATVELSNFDYELAIKAHEFGKDVKISGTISGTKQKKINYSSFETIS